MALGLSEGSEQTAPLARAVIGGLVAATLATLVVLPTVFALVQGWAGRRVGLARSRRPRRARTTTKKKPRAARWPRRGPTANHRSCNLNTQRLTRRSPARTQAG